MSVVIGGNIGEEAHDNSQGETVPLDTLPHLAVGLVQNTRSDLINVGVREGVKVEGKRE